MGWRDAAACQRTSPSIFYPTEGDYAAVDAAKAICAGCPVREACLDDALAHRDSGVWGGTTEDERERIRRARRKAARTGQLTLGPM